MQVTKTIMGVGAPYLAVPWFWSNQYDLRLRTVELSTGFDPAVVPGEPAARIFSIIYLREGRVIALECVTAVNDDVQGKALVANGIAAPVESLADPPVPLKSLAA